jgi:hypothetical protein
MHAVGDLVRCTDGSWMVCPSERCPRGHRLGGHGALVRHQPCSCGQRGGHMTWACRECDAVVDAPPLSAQCQLPDRRSPNAVRMSASSSADAFRY